MTKKRFSEAEAIISRFEIAVEKSRYIVSPGILVGIFAVIYTFCIFIVSLWNSEAFLGLNLVHNKIIVAGMLLIIFILICVLNIIGYKMSVIRGRERELDRLREIIDSYNYDFNKQDIIISFLDRECAELYVQLRQMRETRD